MNRFGQAVRRPGRRQGGFTLVELLLAVTLMSVLLALAYGGLRAATRSSDRGQQLLEETSRLRITHQFVRRQLNLMLPLAWNADSADPRERVVFEGGPEFVQFVAPMPGYLGNGGPQVQLLQLVDGEGGRALVFSHALLQDFEPERLLDRDPVILLEGVREARFEFLEIDEEGLPAGWVTDWQDLALLPKAVRLQLEFAESGDSRVFWPDLVASARLDALSLGSTERDGNYSRAINDLIRRSVEDKD
jgi:general secretion pathway protein J